MKRGWIAGTVGVGTLIVALGCGAEWDRGVQQAALDASQQLAEEVDQNASESTDRERVLTVLGNIENEAENYGIMDIASLTQEVREALADGAISGDEADAIEKLHQGIASR